MVLHLGDRPRGDRDARDAARGKLAGGSHRAVARHPSDEPAHPRAEPCGLRGVDGASCAHGPAAHRGLVCDGPGRFRVHGIALRELGAETGRYPHHHRLRSIVRRQYLLCPAVEGARRLRLRSARGRAAGSGGAARPDPPRRTAGETPDVHRGPGGGSHGLRGSSVHQLDEQLAGRVDDALARSPAGLASGRVLRSCDRGSARSASENASADRGGGGDTRRARRSILRRAAGTHPRRGRHGADGR